jgi:ribonuclease HI/uncharacterized phage-like protein YoqJ
VSTIVYTDGACLGNPGPGGWAWIVGDGPFASGAATHTTNQRMEIQAVLEALRVLEGPVTVMSDSTYVVNCFRDRWWEGWLRRDWKNSQKKPVANRDLWEPLVELYQGRRNELRFQWVKGHGGDPMNDLADRLAVEAARLQQGRSGTGTPADLGAADAPGGRTSGPAAPAASAPGAAGPPGAEALPPGRKVLVAGHRPPELGGYDANPVAEATRAKLTEILAAKRELHPDLVVLTGLGLGAEQLGAEAAGAAGVPYVAVLAYPDPDKVWPEASRYRFRRLREGAQAEVVLQAKAPTSKQQAGAALARRDAWLARHADEAVAVWDGDDDGVGRLVRSLEDHLGADLWVLAPQGA